MSTLFTTASFGSPASFLVLFFSIESISNHHNCLYMFIYSFTVCLHTYTHLRDYGIHKRSDFCVLFAGVSLAPWEVIGIPINICRREEGRKGRRKEGKKEERRKRRERELIKLLGAHSLNARILALLPVVGFYDVPHFLSTYSFFDLSSFECVRFLCNQIIWQQQVWWVILVSF